MGEKQPRDERGEFGKKVTDQDILIAFDTADAPVLTAVELAEQFSVSPETIRQRLERFQEEGKVGRKKTGARSVAWWAEKAPKLSPEAAERVRESEAAFEADDAVALEDAD